MSWTDLIVYDGEVDEVEYDGDHDGGDEGRAPAGGELAHTGAGPVPHQRGHVVVLGVADTVRIVIDLQQGGILFMTNGCIATDLKTLRLELALLTQALVVAQPGQRGHPLLEQPGSGYKYKIKLTSLVQGHYHNITLASLLTDLK